MKEDHKYAVKLYRETINIERALLKQITLYIDEY